jgi:hypothetical protein
MSLLIALHSLIRWLVVGSLLYSIYRGFIGLSRNRSFGRIDNLLRHSTATIAHIQLVIGYTIYFTSPIVNYFLSHFEESLQNFELFFFGLLHIFLMTVAIVLITLGSSLAKRREPDAEKFKTMTVWFLIAFIIILIAIPWPFSPLASRPYLKSF